MQSVKNYFRYQHLYQRGGVTCLHGQRQEARQVCIECVDRYIKLDIIYIKLLNWCKNYLVVLNIYDKCMYGQQTNSFVTSKYKYITCTSTENAEYVQRQLLVVQKKHIVQCKCGAVFNDLAYAGSRNGSASLSKFIFRNTK
uniref:Uncharacterized protein n=1 Tax=Spironucleus salmonicida TaxID=348837 RepID=V6LUX2_9EUKA|eukprot:EST48375.1 Hypothetical protein SS50377_11449 [Spironucleus salmonicida]